MIKAKKEKKNETSQRAWQNADYTHIYVVINLKIRRKKKSNLFYKF